MLTLYTMEQFLRTLALVPLIVAITQGVKSIVPESFYKFLWMFSCGLGVLVAFGYVYALNIVEYNDVMIIMAGVIA